MKKKIVIISIIAVSVIALALVTVLVVIPKIKLENNYKDNIKKADNLDFTAKSFFEKNKDYKDSSIYLEELTVLINVNEQLDNFKNEVQSDETSIGNGFEVESYNKRIDSLDEIETVELSNVKYLSNAKKKTMDKIQDERIAISKGYMNGVCIGMNIAMQMMLKIHSSLAVAYTETSLYPYIKPTLSEMKIFTGLNLTNSYCKNVKKKKKNAYSCVITDRKNDFEFIQNVINNVPVASSKAKLYGVSEEYIEKINDMVKLLSAQKKFASTYYSDVMNGQIYRTMMYINIMQNSTFKIPGNPSNPELLEMFDNYLNKCEAY